MMNLKFDIRGADESGQTRHPQEVMKDLGITYFCATPQSIADQWWFWNCNRIPGLLPPFLKVLDVDPMDCIGQGLDAEMAKAIKNDENEHERVYLQSISLSSADDNATQNMTRAIRESELRIGNLVDFNGVKKINGMLYSQTQEEMNVFFCSEKYGRRLSECAPIPLTEDWLLRFGFEKSDRGFFREEKPYELQWGDLGDGPELVILSPDGCTHGHTIYFPCKYVHQLQNLLFSLTGQELTIHQ